MIYWDIQTSEDAPCVHIDAQLVSMSATYGMDPSALKSAWSTESSEPIVLRIISKSGKRLVTRNKAPMVLSDILHWGGWTRIFSKDARILMIDFGSKESDFLLCELDSLHGQIYFMYLPDPIYNIVDESKSDFLHKVPMSDKSLLRLHMVNLVFNDFIVKEKRPPHCFFSKASGMQQMLGEMFVSDKFKKAWEKAGFTGAHFRKLST